MDSSQCVYNPGCAGECACSVRGLGREFTGGDFLEMLIGKEKVAFHQKDIFVEISLL